MKYIASLLAMLMLFIGEFGSHRLTQAEEQAAFTEGEPHASTLDFRLYFETMSASVGACTLSVQKTQYDAEPALVLLDIVEKDIQALSETMGIAAENFQPCTVYVVEKPFNGMERQGDRIYCTYADAESGRYRPLLACAMLGTEEYWKGAGLAGAAFGAAVDEAVLAAAYQQMDDLDSLSLFISYFTPPFATEEEIRLAEQTSSALCRFMLENYPVQTFVQGDCIAARQEWLHHIGVNKEYADPYHPMLMNYRFAPHSSYPLVAINQYDHKIYLAQMEDMASAKDLRMFLYDMLAGPQTVLTMVEEQAPERLEAVKARYEGRMWVYCGSADGSYTYVEGRNIYLQLSYGYLHELGHILFPTPRGADFYSQMWQYEALSEYLGNTLYPTYAREKSYYEALYFYTGLDQIEDKTANQRFYVKLFDLYLRNAKMSEVYEDVDAALFNECIAAVPLVFPDAAPDSDWVHPVSYSYPGLRNINGNELTYQQAYSFAAWLIEKYSFAAYLDFCLDGLDFGDAFGIPYEEAKAAWLNDFLPAIQRGSNDK